MADKKTRMAHTPSSTTLPPGLKLRPPEQPNDLGRLGNYRVIRKLGQGGMGIVFLGHDLGLDRPVALKVVLPDRAADKVIRERFLREARAAAKVRSDHVVTIFAVGTDNGTLFVAMELLQGQALDERYRGQRVPWPEVVRIGYETATGLQAAHALGLVHRDIKPANLWLEAPTQRVKILDFGLARLEQPTTSLTQSGQIVGTPGFLSPEQASAGPLDSRCDVFSLGAVLYLLLTGRVPFTGPTVLAALAALAVDDLEPIRTHNSDVPAPLAEFIERMLTKSSQKRPDTATARTGLAQWLPTAPPSSQPPTQPAPPLAPQPATLTLPAPTASLPAPRRPWWWLIGVGGLLVAVGLVLAVVWPPAPPEPAPFVVVPPSTIPVPPPPAPPPDPTPAPAERERAAAEVLHAHCQLDLLPATGQRVFVMPNEALPTASFQVKGVRVLPGTPTKFRSSYFRVLPDLPHLTAIVDWEDTLRWSATERAALAKLPCARQLEVLGLANMYLQGPLVRELAAFPQLHSINIWLNRADDEEFARFVQSVPNLYYLQLSDNGQRGTLTLAGFAKLQHLTRLTQLRLFTSKLDRAWLAELVKLPKLEILELNGTNLDDKLVTDLAGLTKLRTLDLAQTKLSDAGLEALRKLTNLRQLTLHKTTVTAIGLRKLSKSLPQCKIDWDGPTIGPKH
jgi:hypothetical protein